MSTPSTTTSNDPLIHEVTSPLQAAPTQIKVLLPDKLDPSRRYPVIYVLPVEPLNENHYGDGLLEVKAHDLHNHCQAIFVTPTFAHLPWYADHAADPKIRQESYFINEVLPLVEKTYPARPGPAGRYLLGFSKSGWGAFSLLLRHPQLFAKAAAWDAPLILIAQGNFALQMQQVHELMLQLHISHTYRDGPSRAHTWHSGWVSQAVQLLLGNVAVTAR